MNTPPKTAIILGATGLTGNCLLRFLLEDPRYGTVKLFSRSKVGIDHPKIEEHLLDLLKLDGVDKHFSADEVYCCIGTTRAKTPDKVQYELIDFGIPVDAARMARKHGVRTFIVISSLGANPNSPVFYNRIKGRMESRVTGLNIPRTFILRPSLIAGKRKEIRLGEWFARQLMKVLNLVMVGPLDKYRSIYPEQIARAMIWLANNPYNGNIVPSDQIRMIADKYNP